MRPINPSARQEGALQQAQDGRQNDICLAPANGRGLAGSCHGSHARKHPQSVTGHASLRRGAKSARQHLPGERSFFFLQLAGGRYWIALVLALAFAWAVTL